MGEIQLRNPDSLMGYAQQFARSGMFADTREAAQAFVKIAAGVEMGFGPFQSLTGVHIVKGKPVVSAGLMAAAVKRHPKYDYRVTHHDDQRCTIEFVQEGKAIGVSEFTIEQAKAAGLLANQTWKSYPKNMLFARAMSNGVKWYTPDVLGTPVYTPDELGLEVDEEGEVVTTTASIIEPQTPAVPALPEATPTGDNLDDDKVYLAKCLEVAGIEDVKEAKRVLTNLAMMYGAGKPSDFKGLNRHRFIQAIREGA